MKTLRNRIAGGVLAAGVVAAGMPAWAQDAAGAPQPAAEKCSFLGCLLHGRGDAPSPQSDVAAPTAGAAGAGGARGDLSDRAADKDAASKPAAKGAPAKGAPAKGAFAKGATAKAAEAAKPAPTVTVAADAAEAPRLKALAAVRPRHRLRLVAARSQDAELTLAPALDAAGSADALPLYSEQLHVLAGSATASLADLRDKPVSFGPPGGATEAIARRAFAAAGVAVKETPLDQANALDGVATGDVAAVVIVAAQPAPVLARLRAPGLHLVDWPQDATLPSGARLQPLKAKSYPRLAKGEIHVLAVDGVLTLTAKGETSAAARGLFASLKQRTASLARRGFDRLGSAERELHQGRAVAKDRRH